LSNLLLHLCSVGLSSFVIWPLSSSKLQILGCHLLYRQHLSFGCLSYFSTSSIIVCCLPILLLIFYLRSLVSLIEFLSWLLVCLASFCFVARFFLILACFACFVFVFLYCVICFWLCCGCAWCVFVSLFDSCLYVMLGLYLCVFCVLINNVFLSVCGFVFLSLTVVLSLWLAGPPCPG